MQFIRALIPLASLGSLPLLAVYAPIPEQEQGKAWAVTLTGNIYHDSNIFGAATNRIDSMVYRVSPQASFNASLTAQTFLSTSYRLTLDHVESRPGDKNLDSHDFNLRVAHAFRPGTTIDVTESFLISKNPESLLAGIPLNTDQSFRRNQVDARFVHGINNRVDAAIKARVIHYNYDNAVLAASLDRSEVLFGVSGAYRMLPETKLVGEYRYQRIGYDAFSALKDKRSSFFLVGVDYAPGPKLSTNARIGMEYRSRDGERSEDAPYAELSVKYDYGERSYVAAGYAYTFEETSNVVLYTDTQVHRFFANVQHALSPLVIASGSVNIEPSTLQGRRNVSPNRSETTVRLGTALTWLPRSNWAVSGTIDYDRINSQDAVREMSRTRVGISARYSF